MSQMHRLGPSPFAEDDERQHAGTMCTESSVSSSHSSLGSMRRCLSAPSIIATNSEPTEANVFDSDSTEEEQLPPSDISLDSEEQVAPTRRQEGPSNDEDSVDQEKTSEERFAAAILDLTSEVDDDELPPEIVTRTTECDTRAQVSPRQPAAGRLYPDIPAEWSDVVPDADAGETEGHQGATLEMQEGVNASFMPHQNPPTGAVEETANSSRPVERLRFAEQEDRVHPSRAEDGVALAPASALQDYRARLLQPNSGDLQSDDDDGSLGQLSLPCALAELVQTHSSLAPDVLEQRLAQISESLLALREFQASTLEPQESSSPTPAGANQQGQPGGGSVSNENEPGIMDWASYIRETQRNVVAARNPEAIDPPLEEPDARSTSQVAVVDPPDHLADDPPDDPPAQTDCNAHDTPPPVQPSYEREAEQQRMRSGDEAGATASPSLPWLTTSRSSAISYRPDPPSTVGEETSSLSASFNSGSDPPSTLANSENSIEAINALSEERYDSSPYPSSPDPPVDLDLEVTTNISGSPRDSTRPSNTKTQSSGAHRESPVTQDLPFFGKRSRRNLLDGDEDDDEKLAAYAPSRERRGLKPPPNESRTNPTKGARDAVKPLSRESPSRSNQGSQDAAAAKRFEARWRRARARIELDADEDEDLARAVEESRYDSHPRPGAVPIAGMDSDGDDSLNGTRSSAANNSETSPQRDSTSDSFGLADRLSLQRSSCRETESEGEIKDKGSAPLTSEAPLTRTATDDGSRDRSPPSTPSQSVRRVQENVSGQLHDLAGAFPISPPRNRLSDEADDETAPPRDASLNENLRQLNAMVISLQSIVALQRQQQQMGQQLPVQAIAVEVDEEDEGASDTSVSAVTESPPDANLSKPSRKWSFFRRIAAVGNKREGRRRNGPTPRAGRSPTPFGVRGVAVYPEDSFLTN